MADKNIPCPFYDTDSEEGNDFCMLEGLAVLLVEEFKCTDLFHKLAVCHCPLAAK